MSEYINNREYRQKVLKELIMELHNGKSVDEVKERFAKLIEGISATEISLMENELIKEGLPVSEVQRLCDVHAAVFKGSIEEIHMPENPAEIPGHPVHTFKMENRALERLINKSINPLIDELQKDDSTETRKKLSDEFLKLYEVDKHYLRKENLLFPYLEKYGITAPPKVMWGVDDEIRADLKAVIKTLNSADMKPDDLNSKARAVLQKIKDMIFKENNILIPLLEETLTFYEWIKIDEGSAEYDYTLYKPARSWKAEEKTEEKPAEKPAFSGEVQFDAGSMDPEEINAVLNTLPFDLTFVDRYDRVKYFTQGKERIFTRPKSVIGREVSLCHPPASVKVVEGIISDFKSGKKDHEDFWIRLGDKFVYIRYFAVRNAKGEYLGTLEATQDIKPITELEGEKRLVSE